MSARDNPMLNAHAEDSMTALVCDRYGTPDVLKFVRLARPLPKKGELLIRVLASTITAGDRRVRSMTMPPGFSTLGRLALGWNGTRNGVLGATFAGVVQAVGAGAKGFAPGDAVFGINGLRMGAHAEYLRVPTEGAVAHKPDHLLFEEAAALPFGGTTALSYLERAKLLPGETVLINGASGNVGMAAVQLARIMGADVTGVCSAAAAHQVLSLGAAKAIDYTKEDFTATGRRFDVVFDVVCNHPVDRCLNVLNPGGRLVRITASLPEMCQAMLRPRRAGRQVIVGTAQERADHLEYLADLVGQGRYCSVIARVFPFDEAIKVHRYADHPGHGGSVVIEMATA